MNNYQYTDKEEAALKAARRNRRLLHQVFSSTEGRDVLTHLEEYFQVDLPVFQGSAGNYDPLDAMKRDAYREVFLYIRRQLALAKKETTNQ